MLETNKDKSPAQHKSSVVMDTLSKLGWAKHFNPAIKGQFYFLPRGTVVFNLMADFLKNWVSKELNAMEIRTPVIYDFNDCSIQAESAQFADRTFQVEVHDKTGVLRPGGDYGVMSILSKQKLLHETHLPIALFELVSSFRKNQTRELSGLLRAHTFTLLDSHFYLANQSTAWECYTNIVLAQAKLADFFKFNWNLSLDIQSAFFESNLSALDNFQNAIGNDIPIRKIEHAKNYWTMQHYFVDSNDDIGFCDGQFDLINAQNYDITYLSKNGNQRLYPVICHASFGSVERWIYKLVHRSISSKGHDFPLWLAPTHIRFLTTDDINLNETIKHANIRGIRAEIDGRNKGLADKIKSAQAEWIPFTVIVKDNNLNEVTTIDLAGQRTQSSLMLVFEKIEEKLSHAIQKSWINLQPVINRPILR